MFASSTSPQAVRAGAARLLGARFVLDDHSYRAHFERNALKYGASPQENSSITYQPDVVFVGGADSVKSVSADGLVWTISGSAPNVNQLKPGKIMFASALGVGRVLAVTSSGANRRVILGPVNITDVIQHGTFASSAPIPLRSFVAYSFPSQPGLLTTTNSVGRSTSGRSAPDTVTLPTVHLAVESSRGSATSAPIGAILTAAPGMLPAPSHTAPTSSVGAYQLDPFWNSTGLGVSVVYDKNGLRVAAKVTLHLDKPTVSYRLAVDGGKLTAALELHGAGGVSLGFDATTTSGLAGNVANQRVQIPVEFSFPISAGPVPLTIDFDQVFGMDTAFTAKNSLFAATGAYTFAGTLGFGIVSGSPTVYAPHNLTPTKTLTETMRLLSVGPASVVIAYAAKLSVGIGFAGFRTGPWYELTFAAGATDAGPTSEFDCKKVSLAISSRYGVGYRVPQPVVSAVNAFLGVFGVQPIKATGGLVGPSITAVKKSSTFPPIAACA